MKSYRLNRENPSLISKFWMRNEGWLAFLKIYRSAWTWLRLSFLPLLCFLAGDFVSLDSSASWAFSIGVLGCVKVEQLFADSDEKELSELTPSSSCNLKLVTATENLSFRCSTYLFRQSKILSSSYDATARRVRKA